MVRKITLIGAEGSRLLREQHVRKIHFFGIYPKKLVGAVPAKSALPGAEINVFRKKECSEIIHYTPTFEFEPIFLDRCSEFMNKQHIVET